MALRTIRAPLGSHPGTISCLSPRGEKDAGRDKGRHHLVSPRNPPRGRSQCHPDFLAKTWASAWTQLDRGETKRLACLDLEAPDSTGPEELLSGGCPQPTSCPTGWQQIPCSCKQPVPPTQRPKARGLPDREQKLAQGPKALTPSTECLWQALALRAGQELAPSQSNFNTSYLGGLRRGGLLLHPWQAGGRNEFPPPLITAEGPGLGRGAGTGRMLQEEDSLGSLSQEQRDVGCGWPPSLRGPWAEGAV